jgi:hypothetical protein
VVGSGGCRRSGIHENRGMKWRILSMIGAQERRKAS